VKNNLPVNGKHTIPEVNNKLFKRAASIIKRRPRIGIGRRLTRSMFGTRSARLTAWCWDLDSDLKRANEQ
jgi:hypothetical protein